MKYFFYLFIVGVCILLFACNSLRRIRMENNSGENAELTWILHQDSLHKSRLFYSNSDTVHFKLQPQKPYNRVKMSFGVGRWTPKELARFVDDIQTLEIKWKGGNIKLDSTQIFDYLVIRRTGIDNSQIKIEIK